MMDFFLIDSRNSAAWSMPLSLFGFCRRLERFIRLTMRGDLVCLASFLFEGKGQIGCPVDSTELISGRPLRSVSAREIAEADQ
jgi:hypothetical protein